MWPFKQKGQIGHCHRQKGVFVHPLTTSTLHPILLIIWVWCKTKCTLWITLLTSYPWCGWRWRGGWRWQGRWSGWCGWSHTTRSLTSCNLFCSLLPLTLHLLPFLLFLLLSSSSPVLPFSSPVLPSFSLLHLLFPVTSFLSPLLLFFNFQLLRAFLLFQHLQALITSQDPSLSSFLEFRFHALQRFNMFTQ